jgi:hypothetical protein
VRLGVEHQCPPQKAHAAVSLKRSRRLRAVASSLPVAVAIGQVRRQAEC